MSGLYNHHFLLTCLVFKYPQMSLSNNVSLRSLLEVFLHLVISRELCKKYQYLKYSGKAIA